MIRSENSPNLCRPAYIPSIIRSKVSGTIAKEIKSKKKKRSTAKNPLITGIIEVRTKVAIILIIKRKVNVIEMIFLCLSEEVVSERNLITAFGIPNVRKVTKKR